MIKTIQECRICRNKNLIPVLDLGHQTLTGVFPEDSSQEVTSGPLELVKCHGYAGDHYCGLVQLKHSYDQKELYGQHYGYRSSLNQSIIAHLYEIVQKIKERNILQKGDVVLDIGSNDGTLLNFFAQDPLQLFGVDPTAEKFKKYYSENIRIIPQFFSAEKINLESGSKKAKVVTSISMFYDLPDPMAFMRDIYAILEDDGIWVSEQCYLPAMLERCAYDSVCHEHLGYYGLRQMKWMADTIGLKVIDIDFNALNGGSFVLTMAKSHSRYPEAAKQMNEILKYEERKQSQSLEPYRQFQSRVLTHRRQLQEQFGSLLKEKKRIAGYGASTKGNVLLQFCGITKNELPFIVDVNTDKHGCATPGTHIPIVPESRLEFDPPDVLFVLPWHLKENFLYRQQGFLNAGGAMFFPLPHIHIVQSNASELAPPLPV